MQHQTNHHKLVSVLLLATVAIALTGPSPAPAQDLNLEYAISFGTDGGEAIGTGVAVDDEDNI